MSSTTTETVPAPATTISTITSVIQTTAKGEGVYEVVELPSDEFKLNAMVSLASANRKTFDFPTPVPGVALHGYIDIDDKEIGAYATVFGTQVGNKFVASIDKGIEITINMLFTKVILRLFKEGNTLYVSVNGTRYKIMDI